MGITVQRTAPQAMHHSSYCLGELLALYDLMFNLKPPSGFSSYPGYIRKWRNAMSEAYKLASETAQRNTQHGKKLCDKVCSIVLEPGDRVLVQNMSARRGPGKPRSYWEKKDLLWLNRKMRRECYTATYSNLAPTYQWRRLIYDPRIRQFQATKSESFVPEQQHLHHTTGTASQDDRAEDILSFTPNQLQVQHPNTTVDLPRTEDLGPWDPLAINGNADHLQDVEIDKPVHELQNECTPNAEPEQS